jgi:uncharacterized protein
MSHLTISPVTRRRFVLGKQGLWPGRRWQGKAGAAQAIHAMGMLQIDPLVVVARSHDLKLHSRVQGYTPDHLNELLYTDRQFFDYGAWLAIYPMEERKFWQMHMRRTIVQGRWHNFAEENAALLDEVRAELRHRGALGHRDIAGHAKVDSYRARKDTGLALYYLWTAGELVTHGRRNFDRLYNFTEVLLPPGETATDAEAEAYFARKVLQFYGLVTMGVWKTNMNYFIRRTMSATEAKTSVEAMTEAGIVTPVQVQGVRDLHYALTEDVPLLATLESGATPPAWTPLDTDTTQEVSLIAPLDPVSARGRAAKLFDFEYKWEVYTPAEKRRWGYYVLPILYGDTLVGRLDPKLDRPNKTMLIKGFWLENADLAADADFANALAKGLAHFTLFHNAAKIDLAPFAQFPALRKRLLKPLKKAGVSAV